MKEWKFIGVTALLLSSICMPSFGRDYTNYICPGTIWKVRQYEIPHPPNPVNYHIDLYSVEDAFVDDKKCLAVKSDHSEDVLKYLYVEEDKVWILSSDTQGWELLYDYGLKEGEECQVSLKGYGYTANIRYSTEGYFSDFPQIPYIEVLDISDEDIPNSYCPIIEWIPGIGSTMGLSANAIGNVTGDVGSKLLEVVHEGVIVYSTENSDSNEVKNIDSKSSEVEDIYNLMGQKIGRPISSGIYIKNGKKLILI